MSKSHQLEDRLIDFAVDMISLTESLPNSRAGNHISGQLLRSGTSPAPNYGEAQSAESRKDFIHKIKISLKELRESLVWLKVIHRKGYGNSNLVRSSLRECDELIAIFVSSAKTAESNRGPSAVEDPQSSITNR